MTTPHQQAPTTPRYTVVVAEDEFGQPIAIIDMQTQQQCHVVLGNWTPVILTSLFDTDTSE